MATDKTQVFLALLVIGNSQDGPIRTDPLGKNYTMAAATARRPIGRIGASEAVHRILHAAEWQIVGKNLDNEENDVDVVEEAQVDMRHIEYGWLGCRAWKSHPDLGDVVTAENTER